jgi:hypothetical protein
MHDIMFGRGTRYQKNDREGGGREPRKVEEQWPKLCNLFSWNSDVKLLNNPSLSLSAFLFSTAEEIWLTGTQSTCFLEYTELQVRMSTGMVQA